MEDILLQLLVSTQYNKHVVCLCGHDYGLADSNVFVPCVTWVRPLVQRAHSGRFHSSTIDLIESIAADLYLSVIYFAILT